MAAKGTKKLLVLSVGYGQGHHSAAAALAEYYGAMGWETSVADVCEMASPRGFRLTQLFYQFCVRKAPWLWGVTYSRTDTANWKALIHTPIVKPVVKCLRALLVRESPDLIICTYPLFAYMLDFLFANGIPKAPYAVVVTDALEISRPWMCTDAPLVLVPDEGSRQLVMERYALPDDRVVAAGFPVKTAFSPDGDRACAAESNLQVVYGAYRQNEGVVNDVCALLDEFPQMRLTVIAGARADFFKKRFANKYGNGRLNIIRETNAMAALLSKSHFYIGKAGAATMFECYSTCVPMLVNFLLPGQEEGNLRLLLKDGAGVHVQSTAHLIYTLRELLEADARGWRRLCEAITQAGRAGGAARIAEVIRNRFGI
jgi:processive 1,2-diacylglycerol beta-glucosyltransferase